MWIKQNKHIIAAGLDGDSNMNKFGHISELLHLADSFIKLTAICTTCVKEMNGVPLNLCNTVPAPFTKKLIRNDNVVEVGGTDLYQASCRKHHGC